MLLIALLACSITSAELATAGPATASQLLDRNATAVTLRVNAKGEALITYRAAGRLRHVLAWGAVNAIAPNRASSQVAFKLDYSGGHGKYRRSGYWLDKSWFCRPYTGPQLAWEVTACQAPDGSFWALQAWQRGLPDLGEPATAAEAAWELRLSHWTGPLPTLSITVDWAYRQYHHLFGTFTYHGVGVHGFRATSSGAPLDSFGRNVYLDTFDSSYGKGWKRENSFLTHAPNGSFCYGFYPHGSHPVGAGTQYRATIEGPGVAPDVMWQGADPGAYSADAEASANQAERALGDPNCTV